MKVGRLVVLGQLAEHGPLHGHEIRRRAERTDVAEWGGVPIGSLYRELHLLAEEGLVVAVRSEQVGRRPARTIYEITREGTLELGVLREQALREFHHPPDPVGVALLFAGGPSAAEWGELLAPRRRQIAAVMTSLGEERARHTAHGYLGPLAIAAFRRGELALHAELAWYDEVDQLLAEPDTSS
jgi:DNA-binding PadR family transcriptional regulator